MNPAVQTQMANRLFEAAAQGDEKALSVIISTMTSSDVRDDRGWTALMLAARNGHAGVVKKLLEIGCDRDLINNSGQSASDIARFWGYQPIADAIEGVIPSHSTSTIIKPVIQDDKIFFGKAVLDRAAHRRKDQEWLGKTVTDESTIFVIFNKDLEALVTPHVDHSNKEPKTTFKLLRGSCSNLKTRLEQRPELLIFLGIEHKSEASDAGMQERAWFAMMVKEMEDEEVERLNPAAQWIQAFPGSLNLDPEESSIYAQGRSILAWHDRYGFCPTCGKKTSPAEAGYKRECVDEDCRSRKGVHNTCYPRVDPTVIMTVVSPDGKRLLLGRGGRFPKGMYSCLAGFLEPGESIESACRREVLEEAGVEVGRVEYHSCQPWPMPSSLMIGCIAYATSDNIQVDKEELEDARWFSRTDVINMLSQRHSERLYIPPDQAIAHVLIRAWVKMTSNL